MILIGLSGVAGSGKNFVGDQIMATYENVKQIAFADPLKQVVHHMFNIPLEDCYTETGKNKRTWVTWGDVPSGWNTANHHPHVQLTVRELLQLVGTDLVRNGMNRAHWINLAKQRIEGLRGIVDVVVVTDVRFDNERDTVWQCGGRVLTIAGRSAGGTPSHPSEALGFKTNGTVVNGPGTTAEELMAQVKELVPELVGAQVREVAN